MLKNLTLTLRRDVLTRIEVLEQAHLVGTLVVHEIPLIARPILGVHGRADIIPPYEIDLIKIVVIHRFAVGENQGPVLDGMEGPLYAVRHTRTC
jgi:hypothetical protein